MQERSSRSWCGTPDVLLGREKMILGAMTILYGDETHPGVMEMLQAVGHPTYVLARTTAKIVRDAHEELKDEVPDEVLMSVALEVLALLGEIVVASGLFPCDDAVLAAANTGRKASWIRSRSATQ